MESHRTRLLTAAEEVRLSRRIEGGDPQAKEEMIQSNLGLVHSIARGYQGFGVPSDDLVQEGTVGLIHAVERFDYRRGVKFSTYAVWWIRRAVIDALGQAHTIRKPHQARRRPGAARVTASLDEGMGEDGIALFDLVADPDAVDPSSRLDEEEARRYVWWMLGLLPKRHRDVLVLRYGLHGQGELPHTQIAARLALGEERCRQIEREALHRLRELGGGRQRASACVASMSTRTRAVPCQGRVA
jgi:RNA polymerase primary sigma factor